MNTGEDTQGLRKILDFTRLISLFILSIHFYILCYKAFQYWGWTAEITDRIISNIAKTGLFNGILKPKLAGLLFLFISLLGAKGKKDEKIQKNSIVGSKEGILYETAGALGKGERIFITAKLPDYIRVGRNDCIEKYLFLTTSHDGYGSITAAFTPTRIVCNNTLNAALRNKTNCIRIKHTANVQDRLKIAHQLLGISNQLANELEGVFNQWAKIRVTDNEVKRLIQFAMAPNKETVQSLRNGKFEDLSTVYKNTVENVFEYAMANPTQQDETTKGTLYGTYNSVSGYFQNVRNYKDEESKFKSIMYGTGLQRSQKAFDLCTDFVQRIAMS